MDDIIKGDITINGIKYEASWTTPDAAQEKTPRLAQFLRESGVKRMIVAKRPRGQKLYTFYEYENGTFRLID